MTEFISIPGNRAPDHARLLRLTAPDGAMIRAAAFSCDNAQATAILLTGWSEFIEKYFETIRDLQARGFAVVTMDWRGQGLSERYGRKRACGHIDDFNSYAEDIALLSDEATRRGFPGPQILMSHSMGGAPALQLLANGDRRFAAAVLCAPMTQIFANPVTRGLVFALSSAAVLAGAKYAAARPARGVKEGFENNPLTSDPGRYRIFTDLKAADPEAVIDGPSLGWVRAASNAIAQLHRAKFFERLATPILIISAGEDALVKSDDHKVLAARHPMISRVLIEGARHEILMERDELRNQYWSAFDGFISAVLTRTRSKTEPVRAT